MGQSNEIKLNLRRPRNTHISFCVIFNCYDQRIDSGKEIKH